MKWTVKTTLTTTVLILYMALIEAAESPMSLDNRFGGYRKTRLTESCRRWTCVSKVYVRDTSRYVLRCCTSSTDAILSAYRISS